MQASVYINQVKETLSEQCHVIMNVNPEGI